MPYSYDSTIVSGKEEYKLDVWKTKSMDGNAFPRALFIFKYRSRGKLILDMNTVSVILMRE